MQPIRALQQLAFIALASCAPALYHDSSVAAFEAGDQTALLVGCGQRAAVGHLYCRFVDGELATGSVVVVVPPVDCPAETCAVVTIWANDMRVVLERQIPKGQTYVVVPWKTLLGEQPVNANLRGFWPLLVKWAWSDPASGETLQAAAIGEIRVRVHSASYVPLAYDPSSATWRWRLDGVDYVATDKGRTAVKEPAPVVP